MTQGDASQNSYLCNMFVRKKKNRSGTISIVVVSKAHCKFTEVKNFGVAHSKEEADILYNKALHWIHTHGGQQEFDFEDAKGRELDETARVVHNMDAVLINGTQYMSVSALLHTKYTRYSNASSS